MFDLQKIGYEKGSSKLWVQSLRNREDIALQQFEFYTQAIACQELFYNL
jgi:hypothetical protein